MLRGILFDIDGTLVLSNDAHAHAWQTAFAEHGYEVTFNAVRRLIGMGGDKLISELYSELSDARGDGKRIKEKRQRLFLDQYAKGLKPTPGSRELVQAVQAAGLKTMVASSASGEELTTLLKAGNLEDLLTEATTSDDADNSKPAPDIIQVALDKIDLPPNDVIMFGDTPYDIQAASKAGVRCIALRCGGWQDSDLSGAVAIFDDPADALANRATFGI